MIPIEITPELDAKFREWVELRGTAMKLGQENEDRFSASQYYRESMDALQEMFAIVRDLAGVEVMENDVA